MKVNMCLLMKHKINQWGLDEAWVSDEALVSGWGGLSKWLMRLDEDPTNYIAPVTMPHDLSIEFYSELPTL